MLQPISKLIDFIALVSSRLAEMAAAILVTAMVWEVFARYVLHAPTVWAFDVAYMMNGAIFLLGMAWVMRQNEHISYSWLTKLAHGQITNPTVSSLQQLIDALDQHEGVVRVAPAAAAAAVTATVDVTPEQEDPDQRRIVPLEEA